MSKLDYQCSFDLKDCIKKLGLEERGKVQQFVTNSVLELTDDYVPLDEGKLKGSGHIENGTDVVWGGQAAPYAHYMWGGLVYEDPQLHCAGFQLKDGGWASRKGVNKVPTDRKLQYYNGPDRGAEWVPRMLQNGGLKKIEEGARRIAGQ